MEKSSQIAWKIVPLRYLFPLKVVPLIEVLLYWLHASSSLERDNHCDSSELESHEMRWLDSNASFLEFGTELAINSMTWRWQRWTAGA
jgi:hypothetical protein